jgi:hypothetical protein
MPFYNLFFLHFGASIALTANYLTIDRNEAPSHRNPLYPWLLSNAFAERGEDWPGRHYSVASRYDRGTVHIFS